MEVDYNKMANARLTVCSNINIIVSLMFGFIASFSLLPIEFQVVPFSTALVNFWLALAFFRDLRQHKELLEHYIKLRNRHLFSIILSGAWMILIAVMFFL
jgi:hypothetical protein